MVMNQSTPIKQISPVASDILGIVSGAYTAIFWDGILDVSGALETIQELRSNIGTLCALQKEQEAFTLMLALYDLAAMEIPTSILEIKNFPAAVLAFMREFLADTEDLILGYEEEQSEPPEWE